MSAAAIVTLVLIAATVLALAGALLHVIWLLHKTSFALGTVVAGLNAIAHQTRPVNDIVGAIEGDLRDVREALQGILGTSLTGDVTGAEADRIDA